MFWPHFVMENPFKRSKLIEPFFVELLLFDVIGSEFLDKL